MNTQTPNILLEWEAPRAIQHERSDRWYAVGTAFIATMVVYGILIGAWSMSITFAMVAGLFFLVRNEEPSVHRIRILESGIEFDGKHRTWGECGEFWILQGKDYHELHIASKRRFMPDIVIHTGKIDPYMIQGTLATYLKQTDIYKENILDAIIRFCKL